MEGGEGQDGTIFHGSPLAIVRANARESSIGIKSVI